MAAKADDLRDPEKLTFPAEAQEMTLPAWIGNRDNGIVKGRFDMCDSRWDILCDFFLCLNGFFMCWLVAYSKLDSSLLLFFLISTVLRRPLRVLEFVLVRCPRTGNRHDGDSAVGMNADQSLNVILYLTAQIAFHHISDDAIGR